MPNDNPVIAALRAALEKEPENVELRVYIAFLYAEQNDFQTALDEIQLSLAIDPTNEKALRAASDYAEKTGDLKKAQSYKLLLTAVSKETKSKYRPNNAVDEEWDEVISDEPDLLPVKTEFDGEESIPFDENVEYSKLTLDDVAGLEKVKRRLNISFLAPLKNPEMMSLYGKSLRGGLLLYGPPGCGKTLIAKAIAGELGAKFFSVGLADVLDMWLGNSEKNVKELFNKARRNSPCVLFFDEIDAIGRKRSLTRHNSSGTISQLLAELDGVDGKNDGIFVLAATNHPWDVDTALRRPGRLDRTLLVLPPDEAARKGVLDLSLKDKPTDSSLNTGKIALLTSGYSGADLSYVVETATEYAMEASINTGIIKSISQTDLLNALKEVKPSTKPWLEVAKNYAEFANDAGIYDDLVEYLKQLKML